MDKVVILARVSTDKQEYQRQVKELTTIAAALDGAWRRCSVTRSAGQNGWRSGPRF